MSQVVTLDVADQKKDADYIYIDDPQFHFMYGEYGTTLQWRDCVFVPFR
jgi:translation elongation factor P/translation initiation factor 5A